MSFFDRITVTAYTFLTILMLTASVVSQSTSQDYPTPVTTNEVTGSIKPRDIGDSRLTSYYYQFDASQGDLFLNIVTRNFTGDIDVFTLNGLRPLTKIVVYADLVENETGRVIYFRKPEKMILRIQGRTPGDDAAMFRIKFAGSFVASTQTVPVGEPELPTLTAKTEAGIRVNTVGTIIEVIPKATPSPAPIAEAVDERRESEAEREAEKQKEVAKEAKATPAEEQPEKKLEVVVTDNIPETKETTPPPASTRTARGRRRAPPKKAPPATPVEPTETPEAAEAVPKTTPPSRRRTRSTPPKATEPKEPDPLEKVNLVILFKDGSRMERPLSEVLRFTVDKGILTVIAKDGSIGRYSMLDVTRVTIE